MIDKSNTTLLINRIFYLHFEIIKNIVEPIADLYDVAHTSKVAVVSALEKADVGKTHISFYFHPSVKARIIKLDRFYLQQNQSQ